MADFRGTPIEYEPKKVNRFLLEFPTELGMENYLVMSAQLPKIDISAVKIPYFDQEVHVTGKVTFPALQIVLINYIGPSTSQKLMEWLRLHHEILTNRSGYAAGYKKTLIIKNLDPTNVAIEQWNLIDCQLTNVDFGENTYDSDAVQNVTFSVQPDRVETPY